MGKSRISIKLARELGGEIISADSRKIYKYMDIGTAKPSLEETGGIPHHLLDVVEPDQVYSAGSFQKDAQGIIAQIDKRGKLPILVGGSGLYLKAATEGLFSGPGADQEKRAELKQEVSSRDAFLYEKLKTLDPQAAARIHPHDQVRLIRALEVFEATGKSILFLREEQKETPPLYRLTLIGLKRPRAELYRRIESRVDAMLTRGLVEEVEGLLRRGYQENLVSMQGLGYKEICAYLKGEYNQEEALRILKRNTRRYAKRQLTWFRRDKRIHWIDVGEQKETEIIKEIKKTLAISEQAECN